MIKKGIIIILILICYSSYSQRIDFWAGTGIGVTTLNDNSNSGQTTTRNSVGIPLYLQVGASWRKFSAGLYFSNDFIVNKSNITGNLDEEKALTDVGFNFNIAIFGEQDMGNSLSLRVDYGSFLEFNSLEYIRLGAIYQKEVFNENFLFASIGDSFFLGKEQGDSEKNRFHLFFGLRIKLYQM